MMLSISWKEEIISRWVLGSASDSLDEKGMNVSLHCMYLFTLLCSYLEKDTKIEINRRRHKSVASSWNRKKQRKKISGV